MYILLDLRECDKGKFCECCGKPNEEVWAELKEGKPDEHGKIWDKEHMHFTYASNEKRSYSIDYFYSQDLHCNNCEECGEKLSDEDMHSVFESRGEFWGAPCREEVLTGYHCQNCGYEAKF
ncbi:hypothetical protein KY326_04960 [Candidatus Woesearchaeota archaeon]|nr:hypothetical protein [Candidatus Woesearchaeota archaeon]